MIPEKTESIIHFRLNTSKMENITIQTEDRRNWKYSWQEENLKLYKSRGAMTFDEAEAFCVSLGGHLTSIHTKEQNIQVFEIAENSWVSAWLGAKDQYKKWIMGLE